MQPFDLGALALVLAAGLLVLGATWEPPLVEPAAAAERIGERVRIQGMALEVRAFGDGSGRFELVAQGAAVHVRMDRLAVEEQDWVEAQGVLRRDGGLPLLEADSAKLVARPKTGIVPLPALAADPEAHAGRLLRVQGHVERATVAADGATLRLTGEAPSGFQTLEGLVRYEPACVCYALHVARPWTS